MLTFSSGDLLAGCKDDLVSFAPALRPGEETELSVHLSVPEATGRHVTYFRLRTREGHIFGQRLWVDLRVIEQVPDVDADWVSLTRSQTVSPSVAPASVLSAPIVVPQPAPESILEQTRVEAAVPTEVPAVSPSVLEQTREETPVAPVRVEDASVAAAQMWKKVWAKELQVLADMGFSDAASLVPMLQEHVGLPVSLCPELHGIPHPEGMQKLVAALLSKSGNFNM